MNEKERVYQICLGGIGGQGVMLAARILGSALSKEGYNVMLTQSHGIEARGGVSSGEVLYGNCEINRLRATNPDFLLALSDPALVAYEPGVVPGGRIFYDTYMISRPYENDKCKVFGVPFTEISIKEMGSDLYTNLIALGFINGITKMIDPKNLESAVSELLQSNKENNCKALQRGIQEAAACLR